MPHHRTDAHDADEARRLIEQIETRYHEGHRDAFVGLLALARDLEAGGIAVGVPGELQAFSDALELHMFKEEMRLFPMMEQGGNTLIERLIDDLQREHAAHQHALRALRARLAADQAQHASEPRLGALVQAFDTLAAELQRHIRAEDEALFPMFQRTTRHADRTLA